MGAIAIFAVTIVASLVGLFGNTKLIDKSLFRPYWFLRRKQYGTLIASGFMHADLAHLIFNMMTFYFFGFPLERFLGTTLFLVLYFAGMLISHWGTYIKQRRNPEYACLGASGAISAVLFAGIVYFPHQSVIIFPIPFGIPAPLFGIGYLAYTYYASKQQTGRINHDAHFAGALTGLAFVALVSPAAYGNLLRSLTG